MNKNIKRLSLGFAITLVIIVILCFWALGMYSYYDTMPKLVATIKYNDPLVINFLPEFAYSTEQAKKDNEKYIGKYIGFRTTEILRFFEEINIIQLYTHRFGEKRKMLPLIIVGKKIKFLKSGFWGTNYVDIEFIDGDKDVIYCYWVDERFNNFFSGF